MQHRLRPLDLAHHIAELGALQPVPEPRGGLADEPDLGLDQRWHAATEGPRPEIGELAQGGPVEGAGLDRTGAQGAQPAAHLARGALGEGHRQHLRGRDLLGRDQMGDAVGDGPRLARACAGEDADRAARGLDDGPLLGIQSIEHGGGHRTSVSVVNARAYERRPGC